MAIVRRPAWHLPEREVTPEHLATAGRPVGRRTALAGAAAGIALAAGTVRASAAPNPAYPVDRPLTPETAVETYNNFYEFGTTKTIWRAAQKLPTKPWSITFDGMVEKPQTLGLEDLLKQVQVEDRTYRHRCVEAWAITVPWTGFPMTKLVALAKPLSGAKYVRFETLADPKVMPGLGMTFWPWPYTEGVTMAEANNELAFIATGLYGQPLKPQNGAPIRVVLPWKYGFKSIKSIIKVSFTDTRPETFWEGIEPSEYGFWANVNPAVPHPRWSQANEELIGTGERVPTRIYNGYGEQVAGLYAGMTGETLFR
jgi:methionine sulfoxide reductase catalytic subunit